uniref:Uncharacterized protein n=1 Tax=Tetranychus urticae TaxID=32264 RepID=T1KR83_TETUR
MCGPLENNYRNDTSKCTFILITHLILTLKFLEQAQTDINKRDI